MDDRGKEVAQACSLEGEPTGTFIFRVLKAEHLGEVLGTQINRIFISLDFCFKKNTLTVLL